MGSPRRDERGQASPEWLGVVLVVSLAFAAMVAAGISVPGADFARTIAERLACAVNLGEGCGGEPTALVLEYGAEVAELVADHTPLLEYEEGMLALPIDYRECREVACAQGAAWGPVTATNAGEPVTLLSHVIDCRDPEAPSPPEADCSGEASGYLYLQYWAYYPDSQTQPFGKAGYHPDDWESFQVRVGPDGVEERASSHHGYNGEGGDPINDTGWLPGKSAWTEATGRYAISSGSHAGRVGTAPADKRIRRPSSSVERMPHRWTRPDDIQVIPIESLSDEWDEYVGSPDHLPAWLKDVFYDPEDTGTSG